MEEKDVYFASMPSWASQQTIVKILKKVKYRFEPVSEYENTQFICVTEQEDYDLLKDSFKRIGFKVKKKYSSCPLAITVCGAYKGQPFVEPFVFNRDDVRKIIRDVPENYIGEEIL
jgi:hypothetical protein